MKINKNIFFTALFIVIFLIVLFILLNNFLPNFIKQSNSEATTDSTFKIDKIYMYSSAYANKNTISNKAAWNLDLFQYSDIAIYIDNNNSSGLNSKNSVKQIYINNIHYNNLPELGTPSLYYKNINDFGRFSYTEENEINSKMDFKVISNTDSINYDNFEFHNSCVNPLCFGFINKKIKSNYELYDTETPLSLDGSLLKRCNILLNSLKCNFSFDLNIINNLNEHFISNVEISIPLRNSDYTQSIYDGFYKYEVTNISYNFRKAN